MYQGCDVAKPEFRNNRTTISVLTPKGVPESINGAFGVGIV
jgi:hypothetical protein